MERTTTETYNKAAKEYADKFAGIGSRIMDIEQAIEVWGGELPRVLELGCGDGRDAVEIQKRSAYYKGVDVAQAMIDIARGRLPKAEFEVADMTTYKFQPPIDIIFAFASLLHINKENFINVLERAGEVLSPGGIFYLSVKQGKYQGGEEVVDDNGKRVFYYYEKADIKNMTAGYDISKVAELTIGHTPWLYIILKKQ